MASSDLEQRLAAVQQAVQTYGTSSETSDYETALAEIQRLQLAIEKPGDFIARMRFSAFHAIAIIMLAEVGAIQMLAEKGREGKSMSAAELAGETHSEALLIARLMRILTATGYCDEVDTQVYRSNARTEALSSPGQVAGYRFMTELQFVTGSKIRQFLRQTDFQNGGTSEIPAFEFAHGKGMWQLYADDEDQRRNFDTYMSAGRRGGQAQMWVDRWPAAEKLHEETLKTGPDAVLVVDVGGGQGGQVGAFKKRYPELPGRCICQDLPDTITQNKNPPENVEMMEYDFFTPQPIAGARVYLFRNICHDWPDTECRKFFGNTVAAMDPNYSTLIVDELMVPDYNASERAANMDMNMMLNFNAMERTRSQWETLLEDVGLEVVAIHQASRNAEAVIEAKVKKRE